ncbi:MAG: tol-pal system protein YbgF [Burkholderiales bacterium]|nr:MAG: tol-pal system protein YbgF [Burkholderiales bacterium]
MALKSLGRALPLSLVAVAMVWPWQAHALFGDDEARKAIIELRQRVDAQRQSMEAEQQQSAESRSQIQRSMLDLAAQIEDLRGEVARLRGQNEQLARELSELQRQQADVRQGLESRLRQVEPVQVSHDGVNFTALPAEQAEFEAAMAVLRRAEFAASASAFQAFVDRYPSSGYLPSALYWLGNSHYATKAYREALDSHGRLVARFQQHLRTPEAMLAMANSHTELKDPRASRRMLEDLVKRYPDSEAATVARERLARMR